MQYKGSLDIAYKTYPNARGKQVHAVIEKDFRDQAYTAFMQSVYMGLHESALYIPVLTGFTRRQIQAILEDIAGAIRSLTGGSTALGGDFEEQELDTDTMTESSQSAYGGKPSPLSSKPYVGTYKTRFGDTYRSREAWRELEEGYGDFSRMSEVVASYPRVGGARHGKFFFDLQIELPEWDEWNQTSIEVAPGLIIPPPNIEKHFLDAARKQMEKRLPMLVERFTQMLADGSFVTAEQPPIMAEPIDAGEFTDEEDFPF